MSVYLTDLSLEKADSYAICLNIFQPEEKTMPKFNLADIVMVKDVLVQAPRWDLNFSLLLRPRTHLYIFRAEPSKPERLFYVPWAAQPKYAWQKADSKPLPTMHEKMHALFLHKHINKNALPDITTFAEEAAKSRQIQDKRRELKDVHDGMFCDLLVQVVSEPYMRPDHSYATLWVSDYTENNSFEYKGVSSDGGSGGGGGGGTQNGAAAGEVGDPNAYLTKFGASAAKREMAKRNGDKDSKGEKHRQWRGPRGRFSMFVVCFPPHAEYIHEHAKCGNWVTMKNVRIKHGERGIEGVMPTDASQGSPLRVALVMTENMTHENMDPRFIEALRRKRDLDRVWKTEDRKRKALLDGGNEDDGRATNAKERRKLKRLQGRKPEVNPFITCEFNDKPVVPLALVLGPRHYVLEGEGGEAAVATATTATTAAAAETQPAAVTPSTAISAHLQLPFANVKFKAHVRVVDYLPKRLEDFAVRRRQDEFAILGGDEDEDEGASIWSSSEDEDGGNHAYAAGAGEGMWEWRFALLLEDASQPAVATENTDPTVAAGKDAPRPARVWAVVNDFHGQTLLGRDACDLRKDKVALAVLREKMFLLWGTLLETKTEALRLAKAAKDTKQQQAQQREEQQKVKEMAKKKAEQARAEITLNKGSLKNYPQPPIVDDQHKVDQHKDEDESAGASASDSAAEQQEPVLQKQKQKQQHTVTEQPQKSKPHSSRPFYCCLQQYGILEFVPDRDSDDDDSGKDDEGGSKRVWQQTFGMFGTTIRG